jgi:hypothetical protein
MEGNGGEWRGMEGNGGEWRDRTSEKGDVASRWKLRGSMDCMDMDIEWHGLNELAGFMDWMDWTR